MDLHLQEVTIPALRCRSSEDLTYQFQNRLTIITGQNGVGKTQFLKAICEFFNSSAVTLGCPATDISVLPLDCNLNPLDRIIENDKRKLEDRARDLSIRTFMCSSFPKDDPVWKRQFPKLLDEQTAWHLLQTVLGKLSQRLQADDARTIELGYVENELRNLWTKTLGCGLDVSAMLQYCKTERPDQLRQNLRQYFEQPKVDEIINQIQDRSYWGYGLSPGQRLQVFAAGASANTYFSSKPLFLLDEIDAHLHASGIEKFLEVVQDCLINNLGGQVIMVTHTPVLVSLALDASITLMTRENGKLTLKDVTKESACMAISTRSLIVSLAIRHVFCEAKWDTEFYALVLEQIRTKSEFRKQLVFVSTGGNADPKKSNDSNCAFVKRVVEALSREIPQDSSLLSSFGGLIDGDNRPISEEEKEKGLVQLYRYSIENYILDPRTIHRLLIMNPGWTRDENLVAELQSRHEPQIIANFFFERLRRELPSFLKKQRVVDHNRLVNPLLLGASADQDEMETVRFGDLELEYPKWFLFLKGHWLETLFAETFQTRDRLYLQKILPAISRDPALLHLPTELEETIFKLAH